MGTALSVLVLSLAPAPPAPADGAVLVANPARGLTQAGLYGALAGRPSRVRGAARRLGVDPDQAEKWLRVYCLPGGGVLVRLGGGPKELLHPLVAEVMIGLNGEYDRRMARDLAEMERDLAEAVLRHQRDYGSPGRHPGILEWAAAQVCDLSHRLHALRAVYETERPAVVLVPPPRAQVPPK